MEKNSMRVINAFSEKNNQAGNADTTQKMTYKLLSGVSVVIPARNEERNIGPIIEKTLSYCDEVVVVDGHSKDKTKEVAESYGVSVVKDNKKGKGDALRVAAAVKYKITVFMDADGSHDPADLDKETIDNFKALGYVQ